MAARYIKCKTKCNYSVSRNKWKTKIHFDLFKVEINFSLLSYTSYPIREIYPLAHFSLQVYNTDKPLVKLIICIRPIHFNFQWGFCVNFPTLLFFKSVSFQFYFYIIFSLKCYIYCTISPIFNNTLGSNCLFSGSNL